MLIRDILARNARIYPERVALSMGPDDVTYRDLAARASRYASALQALGVAKGDRVAVLTHNSPPYVELLYAVTQIGGVLVPLNYLLIGRELKAILRGAGATALLFESEFRDVVDGIRAALPSIPRFLCIDRRIPDYGGLDELAARAPVPYGAPVPLSESDIALQIYTSGTGGAPRGVMLSHRNVVAASVSAALELGLSPNDVYLSATPLPFMAGTGRLLRFQFMGGRVVLLREFDPEKVLRSVEQRRITHVLLTPTMIARILDLPSADRFNLATLRTVLYGGSTIPVALQKRAIRFFRCGMVQIYGQVESAGVLTFLHAEDHSLEEGAPSMRKLTSVGKEAIGVEVRVVDEEGTEIAPNGVGEIVARGPNIFEGYYRDPSATAEVLRNGWLYTGDVASVDEEGYIYIVDRKRDTMMVGGISVSPKEIEEVLEEHPAVREAAVVARTDYTLGEVPAAMVVLKEGEQADKESLLAHCRQNMAPYMIPQVIEFLPSLPRNSQGKILKAKLRERVVSGAIPRTPRR